jgi:hypothetical protein
MLYDYTTYYILQYTYCTYDYIQWSHSTTVLFVSRQSARRGLQYCSRERTAFRVLQSTTDQTFHMLWQCFPMYRACADKKQKSPRLSSDDVQEGERVSSASSWHGTELSAPRPYCMDGSFRRRPGALEPYLVCLTRNNKNNITR